MFGDRIANMLRFYGFFTASTGVWIRRQESFVKGLTYFERIVRLQMVRHFPRRAEPCRGFTVGSAVNQGTDPIVRRLISTG
jgi:hypothetical protein